MARTRSFRTNTTSAPLYWIKIGNVPAYVYIQSFQTQQQLSEMILNVLKNMHKKREIDLNDWGLEVEVCIIDANKPNNVVKYNGSRESRFSPGKYGKRLFKIEDLYDEVCNYIANFEDW
ncbi:MAG: hypothetical protein EOP45_10615 [Sphingobacteriaceae bacterium]|nr:MAG: hypothetical protein EOP45_10615 [Sphingobacteriaceae bacterium]